MPNQNNPMLILPSDINAGAITVDAPIPFKAWSYKGEGRSPQHHYKCSAFDELAAIPVASCAAPNCFLLMWMPLRSVFLVKPLMDAWGFTFSGAGFVWIKLNKRGVGFFMGGGYGTRHNAEVCWLGRRGNPQRKSKGIRELIIAPVREHSRKPDEIYERVEALSDGPYVELFARQQWPGWISIGDEVGKFQRAAE
jgi:N6-adenosine-specific RNA methylase IME4